MSAEINMNMEELKNFFSNIEKTLGNKNIELINEHIRDMQEIVYKNVKDNVKKLKYNKKSKPGKKLINRIYKSKKIFTDKVDGSYVATVLSNAPHSHLVEYGHLIKRGNKVVGRVKGKYFFKRAINKFKRQDFEKKSVDLLNKMIKKGIIDANKFNKKN